MALKITAGVLGVNNGGTGKTTIESGEVLVGNGTLPITTVSRDGIDTRSTFPPTSHTHGNITNAGAIGTTAGLMIQTTTSGVLTALAAGTTSQYLRGDGTWQTVTMPSGLTAGSTNSGYLNYSGTTRTAGQLYGGTTAAASTTRLNYDGYFYATRVYNAVFNDYAEYFEKGENVEAGDVIMKAPGSNKYIKSAAAYEKKVVGVFSDSYGHLLGGTGEEDDEKNFIPIGLAGRVAVKVVGQIAEGDLLTTSNIAGVAMRSEQYTPGTIIGKALESYDSKEIGKIQMLIMNI